MLTVETKFQDVESSMLDALELFQYANRYYGKILLVILKNHIDLEDLATDLKVMSASDIRVVVVCHDTSEAKNFVNRLAPRGLSMTYSEDFAGIEREVSSSDWPMLTVVGIRQKNLVVSRGLELGQVLSAARIFVDCGENGVILEQKPVALLLGSKIGEVLAANESDPEVNLLLTKIEPLVRNKGLEVVVFSGRGGSLFQEIFTHFGSGTLIAEHLPDEIRPAKLADVFEIIGLMKPWIQSGVLLQIDEEEIASAIADFHVYTVNSAIVAAARIQGYGDYAQIARVCTLPRYRRRGYARELVESLVNQAKQSKKTHAFALSIEAAMWQLFVELGFVETSRENLPDAWKQGYDFSRPSKAFVLALT